MKFIKIILFKILNTNTYLSVISRLYIYIIKFGFGKKLFPEMYFLKKIIKKNDFCIDIGANLGYYSFFLSKYSGKNGYVYAIEPVGLFAKIWKKNMKNSEYSNYKLYQYALGESERKLKMGTPLIKGVFHHGMTKIIENNDENFEIETEVEMKVPDILFKDISKIDFIKIDVEGYEHIILKNMLKTIEKHKPPIIQAELGGDYNREETIKLLKSFSYQAHILHKGKLILANKSIIQYHKRDFYFIKLES